MKPIKDEPLNWLWDIETNDNDWTIKELERIYLEMENIGKPLVEIAHQYKLIPKNIVDFSEALFTYPRFYNKALRIYCKKEMKKNRAIKYLESL